MFNSDAKDKAATNNEKEDPNVFLSGGNNERVNDRYYDINKAKDNWRTMSFLLIGLLVFVLGAYLWRSQQSRYQPFMYYQDSAGMLMAMGPADPGSINNDQQIRAHIYKVIDHLRTIHSDRQVMENRLREVFQYYLAGNVSNKLNQYFSDSEHDPRVLSQQFSRSIKVQGIVPMAEDDSNQWKVRWIESTVSPDGIIEKKQTWEAYLTINFTPLENKQRALVNPLGMVVTNFSWGAISPEKQTQ
jgi:type IV secretory pathway TrbF-like protein